MMINKALRTRAWGRFNYLLPIIVIIAFMGFFYAQNTYASTWVHDDWSSGEDLAATANADDNSTGWTKYYDTSASVFQGLFNYLGLNTQATTVTYSSYNDLYLNLSPVLIGLAVENESNPSDNFLGKVVYSADNAKINIPTYSSSIELITDSTGKELSDGNTSGDETFGDGVTQYAVSFAVNNTGYQIITIDLGENKTFRQINSYLVAGVSYSDDCHTYSLKAPSRIDVYYSTNGSSYSKIASDSSIENSIHKEEVTFSPVTARYIRIYYVNTYGGSIYVALNEIEVLTSVLTYTTKQISLGTGIYTWGNLAWTEGGSGDAITANIRIKNSAGVWGNYQAITSGTDIDTKGGAPGDTGMQLQFTFPITRTLEDLSFSYTSFPSSGTYLRDANTLFASNFDYSMDGDYSASGSKASYTYFGPRKSNGSSEQKYSNTLHVCNVNNLLDNSSFSENSLATDVYSFTSWTKGTAEDNTDYYSVASDSKWSTTTLQLDMADGHRDLYQETYDIEASTEYTLTAYYRAYTGTANCDLQIVSYDSEGTYYMYNASTESWGDADTVFTNTNSTDSTDYIKTSITFTTPADIDKLHINIQNGVNLYLAYLMLEEASSNTCSWVDKGHEEISSIAAGLTALWHLDEAEGAAQETCSNDSTEYDELIQTDLFEGAGTMDSIEGWADYANCTGSTAQVDVSGDNMLKRTDCFTGAGGFYYNGLTGFVAGKTYSISAYMVPSTGDSTKIQIYDGTNTFNSDYYSSADTQTFSFTPQSTTCDIRFLCQSTPCDVQVDDVVVTCTDCDSINAADGYFDNAFDFDLNKGLGRGRTNFDVDNSASFTVEAWVNPDTLVQNDFERVIVSDRTAGVDTNAFSLYLSSGGKYRFTLWDNTESMYTIEAVQGATVGKWAYLTAVYDASAKTIQLYQDGQPQANAVSTAAGTFNDGSGKVWIGSSTNFDRYFDGKIDEVAFYNIAKTRWQVADSYGPVVFMYSAASNIPTGAGNAGTIEFWIKPLWDGNDWESHYIFDMTQTDADTNAIIIEKTENNDLRFRLADSTETGYLEITYPVNDSNFAANTWHNITATWNGTDTIEFYLDGVKVGEDTTGGNAYLTALGTYFYLGCNSSDFSATVNGYYDDFRISDKVRDLNEIESDYAQFYTLISSPFDTRSGASMLQGLTWAYNNNGSIKFKLRTASDNSGSPGIWTDWLGPDGTTATYFSISGTDIPNIFKDASNDQWVQYKLFAKSTNGYEGPEISTINLQFTAAEFYLTNEDDSSYTTTAGTVFPVTIIVKNEEGATVTAYSGEKSIIFSGANASDSGDTPKVSNDAQMSGAVNFGAPLTDVTFTDGAATVYVQLFNAEEGVRTITVSSASDSTTTNTGIDITINPADASKLAWGTALADSFEAGETWTAFTVNIEDVYGNTRTTDTNNVTIAPADGSFASGTETKAAVAGVATFNDLTYTVTKPAGLTVTASSGALTTVQDSVIITPDADSFYYIVENIQDTTSGTPSNVTVTVKDQYDNIGTTYTGTTAFTSSDPEADLPENYTFVEGDSGVHTFTNGVTLKTSGTQSVTVTDTVSETITGEQTNIIVTAGALSNSNVVPVSFKNGRGGVIGDAGTVSITLTIPAAIPIPVNGKIVITFSGEGNAAGNFTFNSSGATSASIVSGLDGTVTANIDGQVVTITRAGAGTEKTGNITLALSNVKNPVALGSTGVYKIEMQNSAGGKMAEETNISADTIFGVVFSSPTTGTFWNIGDQDRAVTWTESGTSNTFILQYYDTAWHNCQNNGSDISGIFSEGGDSTNWDIGGALPILTTYKVRMYDAVLGYPVGSSSQFTIAGSLELTAPSIGAKISFDVPYQITWAKQGTFLYGAKLTYSINSTDGSDGNWFALSLYPTSADALNNTNQYTNADNNAIATTSAYWLPSRDIGGGTTNLWLKIEDANTSAPESNDTVNLTVSKISDISFVLPDREGTAIQVGDDLSISATTMGVTHVRIEYLSNSTGDYVVCQNQLEQEASDVSVDDLPFSWRVPDDVYPDNSAKIKVSAAATSGITGAVSAESVTFTIYGALVLTSPVNGSYAVNDPNDRVPIAWTGSSSISNITIQYSRDFLNPVWNNASTAGLGEIYDAETGGTAGSYNWENGAGTAWWQPSFTDSSLWMRVVDSGDTAVYSISGLAESFAISGVSLLGVTSTNADEDTTYLPIVEVGSTKYIRGTGATNSSTVNLYYATDADFTAPVLIGTASIADGDYSYEWTVPDAISSTVYLKAIDPDNELTYGIITSPISIKGSLTVNTPQTAWDVGQSDQTVTGTVKGDIDSVDIQYTTEESPGEDDWTNLATGVSIGNNSGTAAAEFTIAAGSFTIPDEITLDAFKIRVVDSTDGRAEALIAKSAASNGFQVKGYIAVTSPAEGESLYVGRETSIGYNIAGSSIGDLKIYYAYRKSAVSSSDWSDYTEVEIPILNTTNSSYFGTGMDAVAKTYTWSSIPDIVETLIGDGADEQDPSVYELAGNECWIMFKFESTNADATAYSQPIRVKYYKITWAIKNVGGGYLSSVDVSEPAVGYKPLWEVTDDTLCDPPGEFFRYYPYSSGSYSTTFSKTAGGVDYPGTATWQANQDKTVTVSIDTSPTVIWSVFADTVYNYPTNTLKISAWLERQGLRLSSDQILNLDSASVEIYNSSGEKINSTALEDEAPDGNGTFWMSWVPADDGVQLLRGEQYLLVTTITFNTQPYTASKTFTLQSTATYDVNIEANYNANNDSIMVTTSLLENGALVIDSANMSLSYCRILNTSGTDLSGDLTVEDYTTADSTNGLYHSAWDPAAGITAATTYTIIAKITYAGNEYSGSKTFVKSELGSIASDMAQVSTAVGDLTTAITGDNGVVDKIDEVKTTVDDVSTKIDANEAAQSAFRTATTSTLTDLTTSVGTISTNVGSILESVETTLPQYITDQLSAELVKGVQSEILTRPTSAVPDETLTIRYRTQTGLTPTLTLYDASNNVRVNNVNMTEIGATGIYEYDLTINSAWGLGDFTVYCQEAAKGSKDSIVLQVSSYNLASLTSQIDTVDTNITTLSTTLDTIDSNINTIDTIVDALTTSISSLDTKLNTLDTNLDTTLTKIGAPGEDDPETLFGALANVDLSGAGSLADTLTSFGDTITGIDSNVNNVLSTITTMNTKTSTINTNVSSVLAKIGSTGDTTSSTLFGMLSSVEGLDSATLEASVSQVEDFVDSIETLIGTNSDDIATNTIFGRIANIETNLTTVGVDTTNASSFARNAREQATLAAQTAAEIKASLSGGSKDLSSVQASIARIPELVSIIKQVKENLDKVPDGIGTEKLLTEIRDVLKDIGSIEELKKYDGLIPSPESINPANLNEMQDTVVQLKVLMEQVRGLLDKEVNKPVVQGWMEQAQ